MVPRFGHIAGRPSHITRYAVRVLRAIKSMRQHSIQLRVRYAETDQMGFVYYANYFIWFEMARTEFFRALGVEYRKIEEEHRLYIPVVEAYCRYKSPLRYDDLVVIDVKLADMGATRITFDYEVKKDSVITSVGTTKHAFINKEGKPVTIPKMVADAFSN